MAAPDFRIGDAASLLGVSDDTVRRWAEAGRLSAHRSEDGRLVVPGTSLAALAREVARDVHAGDAAAASARNRLAGIVTGVVRDTVMAQVEVQAGPFRVVSLMSREAADELALEVGVPVVARVKATDVVVELPEHR